MFVPLVYSVIIIVIAILLVFRKVKGYNFSVAFVVRGIYVYLLVTYAVA